MPAQLICDKTTPTGTDAEAGAADFHLNAPPQRRGSTSNSGSGSAATSPCSVAPHAATSPAPLYGKVQRSPHHLPQLNLAEEARNSPLMPNASATRDAFSLGCSGGEGGYIKTSPIAPATEEQQAFATALGLRRVPSRRLLPIVPLDPPALAAGAADAANHPEMSPLVARSPTSTPRAFARPRGGDVSAFSAHTAFSGFPRSAKAPTFEQRRIPLPPPATVEGSSAQNTNSSSSSTAVPRGAVAMPGSLVAASVPRSPALTDGRDKKAAAVSTPLRVEELARSHGLAGHRSRCGPLVASAASPMRRIVDRSGISHSPISPSALTGAWATTTTAAAAHLTSVASSAAATPTATRGILFTPMSFESAPAEGLDRPMMRAPTSLRCPTDADVPEQPQLQQPLPPVATADLADRAQAQMVREMLQWRRGGRHRPLQLRTRTPDDVRYAVQPVTVLPTRALHVFGSNKGESVVSGEAAAVSASPGSRARVALPLSPTPDSETSISAVELVPMPPTGSAWNSVGSAAQMTGTNELLEDAMRLQEPPQHQQPQQQLHHHRAGASRSHTSLVSRCSTPEAARVDGSAVLRRSEASPKHGAGTLRRSLPSDRAFACPSSTSLHGEAHREGSGWSRSEVGGPWGGSSRHLNLSTLTISCAPALGSFSTNSDSSLMP